MPILVLIAPVFSLPASLEARWLAELPQPRRDALARWPDAMARHQSLIGSRLLCQGLRHFGHHGDLLASLRYETGGRPTLGLAVDFSISHCDGRVLCAVSTSQPVGIDVEAVGPMSAADFPLYLNARERAWAGADSRRFHSIWTRKEAVAKVAGSGGLADLPRVDTCAGEHRAEFAGRSWETIEIAAGDAWMAHLAVEADAGRRVDITIEPVSRESLENLPSVSPC